MSADRFAVVEDLRYKHFTKPIHVVCLDHAIFIPVLCPMCFAANTLTPNTISLYRDMFLLFPPEHFDVHENDSF